MCLRTIIDIVYALCIDSIYKPEKALPCHYISLSILDIVLFNYYFITTELGGQDGGGYLLVYKIFSLPTAHFNNFVVFKNL